MDTGTSHKSDQREWMPQHVVYSRLIRWKRRFGILLGDVSSLWDGGDHLLLIRKVGYREKSKRFFYKDIQAIICTETPSASRWNLFFLVLLGLVLFFFLALFRFDLLTVPAILLLALVALVVLWMLLINILRGASCRCVIHTAVQSEELTPITRWRTAQKVLPRIIEAIRAAQGELPAEVLATRFDDTETYAQPAPIAVLPESYGGQAHLMVFLFLSFYGVLSLLAPQFYQTRGWLFLQSLFSLVAAGLMVRALIRQRNSTLAPWLKTYTWMTFGMISMLSLIFTGYINVFLTIQLPVPAPEGLSFSAPGVWFHFVLAGIYGAFGLVGLVSLLIYKASQTTETQVT